MAHSVSASHGLLTSAIEGLFDLIKSARKSYTEYRDRKIAMSQLHALSDRELNDMGISRGDIYAVVHGDSSYRLNDWNVEVNENLKGSV